MVILVLKDGLGNQLFQYAAARCLADKLKTDVGLDTSSFKFNPLREYSLHHFCIKERLLAGYERRFIRIKKRVKKVLKKLGLPGKEFSYYQKGFHFDPGFFTLKNNVCIEGYWQSEKYFLPVSQIIREEFVVKPKPDEQNALILSKIKSVEAVSLHVRRGDYVADPQVNAIHGVCSLSYYQRAISYIKQKVKNPHFFIFSDDMEWVKENLVIEDSPVEYMTHNANKDYEDLRLMYSCRYNITANSSFSWWGAWLNSHEEKIVVAPGNWVKERYHNPDLLPDSWVRMEG
ncbi:MAG: alpha-1,2-fucosyltransferase [Bacteroidota bacterium]